MNHAESISIDDEIDKIRMLSIKQILDICLCHEEKSETL